jgi:hypothetical protein
MKMNFFDSNDSEDEKAFDEFLLNVQSWVDTLLELEDDFERIESAMEQVKNGVDPKVMAEALAQALSVR